MESVLNEMESNLKEEWIERRALDLFMSFELDYEDSEHFATRQYEAKFE